MTGTRLLFSQPAFWRQMLKEGVEASRPFVLTPAHGKATGDVVTPIRIIDKARSAGGRLGEKARSLILESNFCFPKRHCNPAFIVPVITGNFPRYEASLYTICFLRHFFNYSLKKFRNANSVKLSFHKRRLAPASRGIVKVRLR